MLIGRETCVREVIATLTQQERPLTLVGPLGVGKSAVALQALRQLQPTLAGAHHIDFARDPDTAHRILLALPTTPVKAKTLVVLDNVDRELDATMDAIHRLQECSPRVLLLITARTRLGYPYESVTYVPPLSTLDAVELLRQTAAAQGAHTQTWDAITMTRIVRQLDHMPLAIELCSRFAVTTQLEVIAQALSLNRNWLEHPCVDCSPNHRSLKTALRVALDDLPTGLFECLRRLSLFQERFTLQDVLACTPAEARDPGPVAELTALHERSLVQFDFNVGCYSLLNSVRWYVQQTAPADASAKRRFYEFLCRGAERALVSESPDRDVAWLVRHRLSLLEAWLTAPKPNATSVSLLLAASRAAAWCGPVAPALEALQHSRPAECGALPVLMRARLLHAQAKLHERTGETELAMRTYEHARTLTHEASPSDENDATYREFCLTLSLDLGNVYHQCGDARAHECYALAITQSQDSTTRKEHARLWTTLATRATERHALDEAQQLFARANEALSRENSVLVEGMMLSNRGVLHQELGNTSQARLDFERARNLHHQVGHQRFEAVAEFDLGCLAMETAHYMLAQQHFEAAVALASEADDRSQAALALTLLATASLQLPAEHVPVEHAAQWLRDAFVIIERIGNPYLLAAHRVHSGQLRANAARSAFVAGDMETYERELRAAHDALEELHPQTSDEVRLAQRLLRQTLEQYRALPQSVLIATDGSWLQKPPAQRLVLKSDSPSQRLLQTLVDQYIQDRTRCVPIDVLVRRAWPTQHASTKSAMNRLHVALNTLRKNGLADHLQHTAAGYLLRNALPQP